MVCLHFACILEIMQITYTEADCGSSEVLLGIKKFWYSINCLLFWDSRRAVVDSTKGELPYNTSVGTGNSGIEDGAVSEMTFSSRLL